MSVPKWFQPPRGLAGHRTRGRPHFSLEQVSKLRASTAGPGAGFEFSEGDPKVPASSGSFLIRFLRPALSRVRRVDSRLVAASAPSLFQPDSPQEPPLGRSQRLWGYGFNG